MPLQCFGIIFLFLEWSSFMTYFVLHSISHSPSFCFVWCVRRGDWKVIYYLYGYNNKTSHFIFYMLSKISSLYFYRQFVLFWLKQSLFGGRSILSHKKQKSVNVCLLWLYCSLQIPKVSIKKKNNGWDKTETWLQISPSPPKKEQYD